MKKIFALLLLGVFFISFASAWDPDNFKYDRGNGPQNYPDIEIVNVFGLGKTLFEGSIVEHTEQCGTDCSSTVDINHSGGVLIDNIYFTTLQKDGSWIEQDVRSFTIKYEAELPEYETECEDGIKLPNGTIEQSCATIQSGTYTGYKYYNIGEELPEGNYELTIDAKKKAARTVDWIIETHGETLTEWAIWGNISEGDEAEVILNSPENNYISDTPNVQFNCSANITGGSALENISLYTNQSGTWEAKNTTILSSIAEDGLISYYRFDVASGVVVDFLNINNATNNGALRNQAESIINKSFLFDESDEDYIALPTGVSAPIAATDEFTINIWVKKLSDSVEDIQFFSLRDGTLVEAWWEKDTDTIKAQVALNTGTPILDTGSDIDTGWHMITFTGSKTEGVKLYIDAVLESSNPSTYSTLGTSSFSNEILRKPHATADGSMDGYVDETGFWNESLSLAVIQSLFNSGAAQRPGEVTATTETWNRIITDSTLWTCEACDTDGDCGFSTENRTVSLNKDFPNINITAPNGTLSYNYIGGQETLNVTFNDTNLDACWYNYNGTNVTIEGCVTDIKNSTQFTLEEGNFNMTVYANDTAENLNSTFIEWNYAYLENNRTLNNESFETAEETFSINVEGASSATLIYNGTEYTTTKSGDNFNRTIQIPIGQIGNNSIHWRFDDTTDSFDSYQNISETVFALCNATYTTDFLNISFKDEDDFSIINASIPTSTFNYYLGDGTVMKTLTFVNTSVNYNYEFCATPGGRTLTIDSLIQYKQGSAYPQRIFSQTGAELTNTTTDLTLYLLSVSDGLFVTFQVFGGQSAALEGVSVGGTRILEGSAQTVAQGTTDAAGTVTFWLNPDFLHTFTYIATGFETVIESLFPTQTLYTVTMGSGAVAGVNDTAEGVQITILPQGSFLDVNTFYTFTYKINSSSLDLDEFGFELFYNNGTSIHSDSSTTSTGGTLDKSFNTSNETRLLMTYYYITDGNTISQSTYWLIYAPNDFSIYHFLTRVGTYISADMFGVLGDDNGYFAKAMLSIVVLILVTGSISFRYGLSSEAAVTGLLFGVVFMLNMFNLIPTPNFLNFIELGDFLVFVVAIVTVSRILKEERR